MRRREGRAAGKVLRCCAQVVLRLEGGADPVGKEPATPPVKIDPPKGPPFLTTHRCRSRASTRAFFAVVFDRSLRVTAPLPLCATARGRLYLIHTLIGQLKPSRMPQHVGMDWKRHFGGRPKPRHHPAKGNCRHRRATFAHETAAQRADRR
jgi:hypothetical protein